MAWGPAYQETGLVFTWENGKAIHPERVTEWFQRHTKAAGLPRIRLHDIRHSYATAALEAGVPLKVVSARLGHSNINITADTYSHVLDRMDQAAAVQAAEAILGR